MTDTKINELKNDIQELKELLTQAKRKKVQDILSLETRKLETELIKLKETQETTVNTSNQTGAVQKRYQIKLNGYGWDQSDKYIKVIVTIKGVHTVPKEQVYCKLTDKSMELHVDNLDNKDYVLSINRLLEPINVTESHWKQKTDMVIVFLAKSRPNIKWAYMTEVEKKSEEQRSSRFKTDESKDPQDSIMSLMKNMYDTGDDEMKRMIAKAWHEGQQKKMSDTVDL